MKIDGNSLIELMFKPMDDNRVIETIDELGLSQPVLDEQYELEAEVSTYNENEIGVGFNFREIDGYTNSGAPCLTGIDFYNDNKISLPFGLSFKDNYEACCNKFGRKADYLNEWDDEVKIWLISNNTEKNIGFAINFSNDSFQSIDSIIIFLFKQEQIGDVYIPNEE